MSRLRLINLGLPKSGTTTLGLALKRSGLRVVDWKVRRFQSKDPNIARRFLGDLMYDSYFRHGDPLHGLESFDAFTELNVSRPDLNRWPQMDWGLLGTLIDRHPGAKFVLSYRDPEAHAESMIRWTNLGSKRLPRLNIPGLPSGYGQQPQDLVRWIEGHRRFCHRVFAGDDRFLEYDILDPDAPKKIGAFLGMDIAWWGTANENPSEDDAEAGTEDDKDEKAAQGG
ncbi:MAG: sulfotransferase [Pseudomonadota bacterium]